jgi:transcription elongation factor
MARNKVSQNNNLKRRSTVRNFFSNLSLKKSSLRRKLIPPTEKDSVETQPIEDSLTTAICYQKRNLANEENHKTQKVVLECSKEENCGSHQLNHDKENESLSQSESVASDVNDRSSSFGGGLLHIGNNVKVLKGMYVNQYGIVSRLTKKQAYIILNENKKVVRLNHDNLQILYSINDHERGNISNILQDRHINE